MEQVWIILLSRLARALWIEIHPSGIWNGFITSRLARALWIEIYRLILFRLSLRSRLARALWIEINVSPIMEKSEKVEARESLVD